MGYALIKGISHSLGLYRIARLLHRHTIYRDDLYRKRSDLSLLSGFIEKDDIAFDVGANVGDVTWALLKLGANVVAFEPQEDCMEELKRRNRKRNLTTVNLGLAQEPSVEKFYTRDHKGSSGFLKEWNHHDETAIETEVEVTTLDIMIKKYGKPKYIKIDVEGYELEVLKGLSEKIPYISIEYTLDEKLIQNTIQCIECLSRFGKLYFNLTGAENPVFEYDNWIDKNEFLKRFPEELYNLNEKERFEFRYGDIYIHTV